MLHRLYSRTVYCGVLVGLAMFDQLLGSMRILALTQSHKMLYVDGSGEVILFDQLALPLPENGGVLLPIILLADVNSFA